MRGLYTAGVLDYFMDHSILFPYVVGVSAGACNGVSYVSGQRGRSFRINTEYVQDKRYVGVSNLLKTRSMFGMDFLFDTIPHELDIFDYESFLSSPTEFWAGVTDVETGNAAFFTKDHMQHTSIVLRASSAIPCFSPMVQIDGKNYLDGGTAAPIPLEKALTDGCDRVVAVLTRHRGYQKSPERFRRLYHRIYRNNPGMLRALDNRHQIYNQELSLLYRLEAQEKALVIAPKEPLALSRFEKDTERLKEAYRLGYQDAEEKARILTKFSTGM